MHSRGTRDVSSPISLPLRSLLLAPRPLFFHGSFPSPPHAFRFFVVCLFRSCVSCCSCCSCCCCCCCRPSSFPFSGGFVGSHGEPADPAGPNTGPPRRQGQHPPLPGRRLHQAGPRGARARLPGGMVGPQREGRVVQVRRRLGLCWKCYTRGAPFPSRLESLVRGRYPERAPGVFVFCLCCLW